MKLTTKLLLLTGICVAVATPAMAGARSNKGGLTRGKDRAAQVKALNDAKRLSKTTPTTP